MVVIWNKNIMFIRLYRLRIRKTLRSTNAIKLRNTPELYLYTSSYYYVFKITILNNNQDPASTASLIYNGSGAFFPLHRKRLPPILVGQNKPPR